MVIPLDDLRAILHALVAVLTKLKVIDGRAWILDLTRLSTHSSVTKDNLDRPNGKSDPERCWLVIGDGSYDAVDIFVHILDRLRALPVITKNPRNAADPQADLATDSWCVLGRPSLWHQVPMRSRTPVERANGRLKLTFNLRYHNQRGWNAVAHCALFAAIAMLGVAWVAVETGHPDKIRSAWTWISLN
jgi:hypothetical protein